MAKGGAVAGDALILTKALGVGVILAADMAGRAPGPVVAAAHRAMVAGQGQAAVLLAGVAHAMTDVTGFGLAGHLAEMLAGTGLGAEIDLDAVPVLDGALALAAAGVQSSIYRHNRAATVVVGVAGAIASDPARMALLFDPQTCGGLLAAVPLAQAGQLVAALQAMGLPAAVIGRVEARTGIRLG